MKRPALKKARRKGGRPRLSDAEKARRGTLQPCRTRRPRPRTPRQPVSIPTARNFPAMAAGYVRDILTGATPASEWVRLACERQVRDLHKAATDPTWPYVWSDEHAIEACEFIEQLPHIEGSWGSHTIVLHPFQVFILALLFGWRHKSDLSRRRFTVLYLEVARKAAKSTLMAAISLFHLLREREAGASVICGASTGQQARICFAIMQRMVRRSAWLRGQGAVALANAIITGEDGSAKPINAKASSQDGLNPSVILLDESHAQDFELHDVLRSAQGARQNPLLLAPTTAGYSLVSVGYALRTTLTKVLQQVFEAEHFCGAIYTLDEADDWRDERVWVKANPMIGITPTLDWVRTYCRDAQQTPGLEGEFLVKVCSRWAAASSAWLSMTAWDQCADPKLTLSMFAKERCWIGCDLAQLDDLAAVALVFERKGILYGFAQFYLPRFVVDERARAVPAYRTWVNSGLLKLTEGPMIDYSVIESDIRAFCNQFQVQAIVFDQFGSAHLSSLLATDGLPAIVEPKNARTFTPPARELETRVKHGRFRHDGNPCLKWMASNCVVERRVDDSILPKKVRAESPEKIDGIDALLEAMGAMLRTPVATEPQFQMFFFGGRR